MTGPVQRPQAITPSLVPNSACVPPFATSSVYVTASDAEFVIVNWVRRPAESKTAGTGDAELAIVKPGAPQSPSHVSSVCVASPKFEPLTSGGFGLDGGGVTVVVGQPAAVDDASQEL